jgi:hypothetical protein
MRLHRIIVGSGALLAAWALAGCTLKDSPLVQPAEEAPVGASLENTAVPADFTYQTTRNVTLTLSAEDALFDANRVAGIEITNQKKAIVFQGPMRMGEPLVLNLPLPTKDKSVRVAFRTLDKQRTVEATLVDDAASHSFK